MPMMNLWHAHLVYIKTKVYLSGQWTARQLTRFRWERAQLKYKVKSSLYLSLVSQSGQIHRQSHVCHGYWRILKSTLYQTLWFTQSFNNSFQISTLRELETHDGETHLQTASTVQHSPPIKQTTRPINTTACPTASCMLPPGVTWARWWRNTESDSALLGSCQSYTWVIWDGLQWFNWTFFLFFFYCALTVRQFTGWNPVRKVVTILMHLTVPH